MPEGSNAYIKGYVYGYAHSGHRFTRSWAVVENSSNSNSNSSSNTNTNTNTNSNSEEADDYMAGQRQGMRDALEGKVATYTKANIKNNMGGGRRKTRSRKGKTRRGKTRRN